MVNRVHFLECAGNSAANALSPFAMDVPLGQLAGEVSNAEWTGIPLSFLIDEARPKASAKWVIAEGADGGSHARSLPLQALREHGMLALYQNGERLRPSQGYPMRLFVPGWEGNANVKWLHRLEFSDTPAYTKDESGLYTQVLADGRIQRFAMTMEVKSLITRPSGQQTLPDPQGYFEIEGFAWSGRGAIARVDVSVDGGPALGAGAVAWPGAGARLYPLHPALGLARPEGGAHEPRHRHPGPCATDPQCLESTLRGPFVQPLQRHPGLGGGA